MTPIASNVAILDLAEARPREMPGYMRMPVITLQLMPGDLVLVDAPNSALAAWFADLCCGLVPLAGGAVRFLGRDWESMPHHYAAALRGRIGRVFATGAWIESLDVATNILLPQLHHTRREAAALREKAAQLARSFGLPGLPMERPANVPPEDCARAACVRAFLGEPALLVLESPLQERRSELLLPLLNAVAAARNEGAAAIWLADSDPVWGDRSFPATSRFRLSDQGLAPVRRSA
ncbi:MAG: ABC transporter ATP-binding protein [Alphaproteobacteria bacterium]|nr:ABC transporter ATP-binding protein [Alphaproteobacteria bacterium]